MALPFEQSDDKIWSLLMGLSEMAYPTSEAHTRSLANVRMLRRESMLHAAKQDSAIAKEIRKAPLLGQTDAQFSDTTLENVAALGQVVASRSTAVALQNHAAQKPPSTNTNPPRPLTLLSNLWEVLEVEAREVRSRKPTVGRLSKKSEFSEGQGKGQDCSFTGSCGPGAETGLRCHG